MATQHNTKSDESTEKICIKCEIVKPLIAFRYRSNRPIYRSEYTARQSMCKACEKTYQRNSANRFRQYVWNGRRYTRDNDLTVRQLRELAEASPNCYLCGEPLPWDDWQNNIELDHVIPKSQGGAATISNVRWCHRRCNRMKHDMTLSEFEALLRKILSHSFPA